MLVGRGALSAQPRPTESNRRDRQREIPRRQSVRSLVRSPEADILPRRNHWRLLPQTNSTVRDETRYLDAGLNKTREKSNFVFVSSTPQHVDRLESATTVNLHGLQLEKVCSSGCASFRDELRSDAVDDTCGRNSDEDVASWAAIVWLCWTPSSVGCQQNPARASPGSSPTILHTHTQLDSRCEQQVLTGFRFHQRRCSGSLRLFTTLATWRHRRRPRPVHAAARHAPGRLLLNLDG